MSSLNKVFLIGRLGKDPEMQRFDSGAVKANFSLATSESYTNKAGERVEQTEWHNIVIWRKGAEIAEKYLRKGSQIFVEGKIKNRSWDDADGNKRYITEIECFTFKMLGSRSDSGTGTNNYSQQNSVSKVEESAVEKKDDIAEEMDDLPF